MAIIMRLVHALPNAWLPGPGQHLRMRGVNQSEASELVGDRRVVCHIRYDDTATRVQKELGIAGMERSGENCPNPLAGGSDMILLCVLSPGSTEIQYVYVYDGGSEESDHQWRYEMTKFA